MPRAEPEPQSCIHKYCQERAGLPGMPIYLRGQVRPPLLFKFLAQEGPSQSHQDTGTKDQPGTGSFWFLSVPQLSIPKFLPERTGLPGLPTHRLAGGTIHSQRQQDLLTPEITRLQKVGKRAQKDHQQIGKGSLPILNQIGD